MLNETPFEVGTELFTALTHLRSHAAVRILWVDALCINQQAIPERNDQVSRMGSIYSRARRVLVWLGPATTVSRQAFDFLSRSYEEGPNSRRAMMEDPGWLAMKDLYNRGYWKRVWIIQELCLAREAVVICGRTKIPWRYISSLREALNNVWTVNLSSGEFDFRLSPIAQLDDARAVCKTKGCSLWTLLEKFRDSQCHDVHDKIYGFLGLASDCNSNDMPIDYSKSVGQLLKDVIWLQHEKFCKDKSSPNAAQLMAFSHYLQEYLIDHPGAGIEIRQVHSPNAYPMTRPQLSISASALLKITGIPTPDQAHKYRASELMQFLRGELPYSHLSFWREKIDPELNTVYALDSPQSSATVRHDLKLNATIAEQPLKNDAPFVVVAEHLALGTRTAKQGVHDSIVIAIVPPGMRYGDMICTFVGCEVALVLRPASPNINKWSVVGRAHLDYVHLDMISTIRFQLDADKTIERITSNETAANSNTWPATVSLDTATLQCVIRSVAGRRLQRPQDTRVDLMPSSPTTASLEPSNADFQIFDTSQRAKLEKSPGHIQYMRAPAVGIYNLGGTGYISCMLQLLYHLKPVREV